MTLVNPQPYSLQEKVYFVLALFIYINHIFIVIK